MPWTEEPGGLQIMGSQRVRYDLATKQNSKSKHSFNHMNFRIICITLVKNILVGCRLHKLHIDLGLVEILLNLSLSIQQEGIRFKFHNGSFSNIFKKIHCMSYLGYSQVFYDYAAIVNEIFLPLIFLIYS